MTKLNLNTQKTLTASAMIVGLASVAGSAAAAPTAMDATATVQNAVTITQTTPLNFGTVFATSGTAASAAANATTAAPISNKLVLAPTGGVTAANGTSTIRILSIGGTPTAGVYSIPALPQSSKVAVLLTTSTGVAVVNSPNTTSANCGFENPTAALAAGKIALSLTGSNPASTAFFCLDTLTASVGGAAVAAGELLQTSTALAATSTAATGYTLGFGLSALTFNLGATLVQQVPLTGTRAYEVGAYTGTVGMEVTFL
jgi:hypothetical protein